MSEEIDPDSGRSEKIPRHRTALTCKRVSPEPEKTDGSGIVYKQEKECVKNEEGYKKKKVVFLAVVIAILAAVVFCFISPGSVGGPSCVNPCGSGSSKEECCKDAIMENVQSAMKSQTSGHLKKKLKVVLLCSEWGSSKGGLSTFNRQLAIYLAKRSDLEVSCYLAEVSDRDKNAALKDNVTLFEAEEIPGNRDPLVKLQHLPAKLPSPDVIISHGRKFGPAAYLIKKGHPNCKWVHFVHVNYEEMGKYKVGSNEIRANNRKYTEELRLCKKADIVVAVGPQLFDWYSRSLSIEQKEVQVFYPGLSKIYLRKSLRVPNSIFTYFVAVHQKILS